MKSRVKIDNSLLIGVVSLTGLFFIFPKVYLPDMLADDLLDLSGMLVVFSGTFLRMIARGYKKENSGIGYRLVQGGPYSLVRNPMYLGSFLMGAGFLLIVWPWWMLPLFAFLFYSRFKIQIAKEEAVLLHSFGMEYQDYMKAVPRIFPRWGALPSGGFQELFPGKYIWTTKEKWWLLGWPVLAGVLELVQEKFVYGFTDVSKTAVVFLLAIVIFMGTLAVFYLSKKPLR